MDHAFAGIDTDEHGQLSCEQISTALQDGETKLSRCKKDVFAALASQRSPWRITEHDFNKTISTCNKALAVSDLVTIWEYVDKDKNLPEWQADFKH